MAPRITLRSSHRPRRALALTSSAALAVGFIAVLGAPAAGAAQGEYYASPAGSGDCSGASSPCSLDTALAKTDASTIYLVADSGTAATFATSSGWDIGSDVTIQPASGVSATFDGQDSAPHIFSVGDGTSLTISGVTIQNTNATDTHGGGIFSLNGTVVVTDSTFANSTTTDVGSNTAQGGGITSIGVDASLTVRSSTFVGNTRTSDSGYGGGIIMGNGDATVVSSTFVGNSVGIAGVNSPTLAGNLFAGNDGPSCTGTVTDGGYNVADDDTCNFTAGGTSQTVTLASLALPGLSNSDGLANNGGPTQTVLPGAGSSASGVIPAGTSASVNGQDVYLCGDATHTAADQRGTSRPIVGGEACTAGAVEVAPPAAAIPTIITLTPQENPSTFGETSFTITVTTTADHQPVVTGRVAVITATSDCGGGYTPLPPGSNGTVTKTLWLDVGDHPLHACYEDSSGTYASSESAVVIEHVNRAPTSIELTSSANPSDAGESVTYSAVVNNGGVYTGTLDFVDVTDEQHPITICSAVAFDLGSGASSIPIANCTGEPGPGQHTIKAAFSGNDSYEPSTATLTQTVTSPAPAAPVITAPADGSTTKDTTPLITGTGEVGDTVTVTVDGHMIGTTQVVGATQSITGASFVTPLAAVDDGTWSLSAPPLSDGSHTVVAFQTDPAGNDSAEATTTFRVASADSRPTPPSDSPTPSDSPSPSDSSAPSSTASSTSAVPPTGETTPADGDGSGVELASTGTPGLPGLLAVALGAILAGAALLWRPRRPGRHA